MITSLESRSRPGQPTIPQARAAAASTMAATASPTAVGAIRPAICSWLDQPIAEPSVKLQLAS